ncbi:MAG: hypothetical protein ACYTEN_12300, partial [Planctomycetota bacterium]
TDAASVADPELPDIILKHGMKIPEAMDCLVEALSCPVSSVKDASAQVLLRLYDAFEGETEGILKKALAKATAISPGNKQIKQLCNRLNINNPSPR